MGQYYEFQYHTFFDLALAGDLPEAVASVFGEV